MGFANWPSYQDGTGTYMDGNVPNKALLDAIKASLEGDLFSTANPAISMENLIDEVVTARGTEASVDARLDVSLNHDGSMKNIAGSVTSRELSAQMNRTLPTPVFNSGFEEWQYNTAGATPWDPAATETPIGWTGDGMSVSAHTGGSGYGSRWSITVDETDTTRTTYFYQRVIPEAEMAGFMQQWQTGDRKVTFGIYANKIVGNDVGTFFVDDGVTITEGPAIGAAGYYRITHTINSHATYLRVGLKSVPGSGIWLPGIYELGGSHVIFNDLTLTAAAQPYRPGQFHYPKTGERHIAGFNSLSHGNAAGAGQTVLWRYHDSIPANALYDYSDIHIFAQGTIAANADANKILRVYAGTHFFEVFNTAANVANNRWVLKATIKRTSPTAAFFIGKVSFNAAFLAVPTIYHLQGGMAGGAVDWTTPVVISINGASATADTVVLNHGLVTFAGIS